MVSQECNGTDGEYYELLQTITDYCFNGQIISCNYESNTITHTSFSDINTCQNAYYSFTLPMNQCNNSVIVNCTSELLSPPQSYSEIFYSINCRDQKLPAYTTTTPIGVCIEDPELPGYYFLNSCNSTTITQSIYISESSNSNSDSSQDHCSWPPPAGANYYPIQYNYGCQSDATFYTCNQ
ncbi:hypothetical protein DLAC_09421 [Tieghemostelium lacteum]|uniref:Uncharacterized protein n=1 Tax=Tieghemostelium lacteum TaxID=361077 RepID=A0A151ZA00_TIELA|nr:hypothetical protein DLAC_09421 [Tieghemostelium lacteum]|eukprot:KYQ90781.1 hypothetical protein DLAC_09421 [Tieghemostelium lacteum]